MFERHYIHMQEHILQQPICAWWNLILELDFHTQVRFLMHVLKKIYYRSFSVHNDQCFLIFCYSSTLFILILKTTNMQFPAIMLTLGLADILFHSLERFVKMEESQTLQMNSYFNVYVRKVLCFSLSFTIRTS